MQPAGPGLPLMTQLIQPQTLRGAHADPSVGPHSWLGSSAAAVRCVSRLFSRRAVASKEFPSGCSAARRQSAGSGAAESAELAAAESAELAAAESAELTAAESAELAAAESAELTAAESAELAAAAIAAIASPSAADGAANCSAAAATVAAAAGSRSNGHCCADSSSRPAVRLSAATTATTAAAAAATTAPDAAADQAVAGRCGHGSGRPVDCCSTARCCKSPATEYSPDGSGVFSTGAARAYQWSHCNVIVASHWTARL